jgi:hypothetical protein
MPRYVYVSDVLLTGPKQAVSLWEIQDPNDRVNLGFLARSLQEAHGGALGVQRLEEVRLGYPDKGSLAQWDSLLTPAQRAGERWLVGRGPALRPVPGSDMQIESIVLKVESLEKAKTVLAQGHLLGQQTAERIELDPAKICGLRIALQEK